MLRVSGGTSVLQDDLSDETIITSIEECLRLNAVGMALSVFVGAPHQRQSIANLARLVDEGERYGIPVVAVTAVGKDMGRDARYLSLASRICAEMGAHIVKTYYCEDFEKVVATCPVPVVMAGGKKLPEKEALRAHRQRHRRRRRRRRHGPQHLPGESPQRHDQGRPRRRPRRRHAARGLRHLSRAEGSPGRGRASWQAAALDDERKI